MRLWMPNALTVQHYPAAAIIARTTAPWPGTLDINPYGRGTGGPSRRYR